MFFSPGLLVVSIPVDCAIGPQSRPCATRVFLPSWSMPWRWFEIRIDMIMIGLDNIVTGCNRDIAGNCRRDMIKTDNII